jgi:glutamate synthase domain-containing protein 2/glutamate synthase domain-containing protein 1/glutamate synthase domain-containing protein 3
MFGERVAPAQAAIRQGLYDPAYEHDACGIGFVAQASGRASHRLVRDALQLLENLSHRSGVGCDPCTGDGAGILLQVPHLVLQRSCGELGFALPGEGAYGVGMCFLPNASGDREACEAAVERVVAERGLTFLGWRDVPTDERVLGELAMRTVPAIRQFFVERGALTPEAFERTLYLTRRYIEQAVAACGVSTGSEFYVASLSARTVVYKGLLRPSQFAQFYTDLADRDLKSAIAIVHSRFATNTFPTWARAHPYRMICHNGEINTLRGNLNSMRMRESRMESPLLGKDLANTFPVIGENQSDSASLDNALELLVRGGRSVAHAMMMLVPEAWEGHLEMTPERRAFYSYHSALMEQWDGPAALAFSDGVHVGATLDRNGLRPARYVVTTDDVVILASEAGALPVSEAQIRQKGRLQPGRMLLVDTASGQIMEDDAVKSDVARRQPYGAWVAAERIELPSMKPPYAPPRHDAVPLAQSQRAFGYSVEELDMVIAPMARDGAEAVGSMGNDTPLAVLSRRPQLLFAYFKQLFAQVTNPAIDPIREHLVMSLAMNLGPQRNLLAETPAHARQLRIEHPVLGARELDAICALTESPLRAKRLPMLFRVADGPNALSLALEALCQNVARAVVDGHGMIVLTDRGTNDEWAPIPSLLATGAVHHHLIREGLRADASLVVETGEAREVTHFALLLGYGASAVHPYLALDTIAGMVADCVLSSTVDKAQDNYVHAVTKGLLKILSKMGISTLQSYCGAQIFEAVGLGHDLVDTHFAGTASPIGGIGIDLVCEDVLSRHLAAFGEKDSDRLDVGGQYHYRAQGEHHNWSPLTIASLQDAVRRDNRASFRTFSKHADEEGQSGTTLRGLLDFVAREPVPIDEVESATAIVRRFTTGAMSFGSLSGEAHETMAIAMNRLGGRSNTGEGGEDPARFGTSRNSAIKQVASGRFGVTTEYLVNASELQIKIAQGAKPGEGGQLPGHKVDGVIARIRHATPGVTLISPPPHHDIYSIEDLAQLVYDLKCVNPRAQISVKLVACAGVGTVAAGVAKTRADLIVISGDSGGTGASPLSSIKHAGIPWELGLAETQQTLVLNDLRGRVRLQADGQLKTGRDVVIAALLGAEEFGFSTAPLVAAGCVMMRKCHLNTCPVGIATQDPVLRAKFAGQPEHLINFFFFVAEEVRELMARLGFRHVAEMVGRSDVLEPRLPADHRKAQTLDLRGMLHMPSRVPDAPLSCVSEQDHGIADAFDHTLLAIAAPALERGERVRASLPVRNVDRTIGAMLSGEIARRYGHTGLPDGTIELSFTGSAGQSFGAFAASGLTLNLEGEANDYVGKGLSGGRLVVRPRMGSRLVAGETTLVGNTVLYGATGGEAFFRGVAGERFAVRNSGATAVVEGVGDHGCEYMTGGVVVVLGRTGRNFAAGMSGGLAFVLDEAGDLAQRVNRELVEIGPLVDAEDRALLRGLVVRHARRTGSVRAARLLSRWERALSRFVAVVPREFARVRSSARDAHPRVLPVFARESMVAGGANG